MMKRRLVRSVWDYKQTLYDWGYLLPTFANDVAFQEYVDDLLNHLFQKMEEVLPK